MAMKNKRKSKRPKPDKLTYLMGIRKEILYDHRYKEINLELSEDKIGSPIVVIEGNGKELMRLHLYEAMALKSDIDNLAHSYLWAHMDKVRQDLESANESVNKGAKKNGIGTRNNR